LGIQETLVSHLTRKSYRFWSKAEATYLKLNYGILATRTICLELGRTPQQLWSKAQHLGLTSRSTCRTCGRSFSTSLGKRRRYCSQSCRRAANTEFHRKYASRNRKHLREYARERRIQLWCLSGPEIAVRAEKFALDTLLPRLGFSRLYHASAANRFMPFDIIGTYKGRRVLIDVTTAVTKGSSTSYQKSIARALGMPIFVLFLKPDMTKYLLRRWSGTAKSMAIRLPEVVSVE